MMLRSLCGICGWLSGQALVDCKGHIEPEQTSNHGSAPEACANEATLTNTTSHGASTAPLVDVDALLREAAAVMRPKSDTSGHGDSHSLALVPFRTLLSEIQLEERLGSGAGGTTWKCRWRTTTVAIKLMISTSVDQLRASTREAVCARIVSHPCVVQCYAINITRLTEQDMDLLSTAALPQVAPCSGGEGATSSHAPWLCLDSPSVALGASAMQSHPQRLQPQQAQHNFGSGWLLAREGGPLAQICNQDSHGLNSSIVAEAAGAVRGLQEARRLEVDIGSTAASADVEVDSETAGARTGPGRDGAIRMQNAPAMAMAGTASAPPLSQVFENPNVVVDSTDSALMLLRAATGAVMSDRWERALEHSQTYYEPVDAQGTGQDLLRQRSQQQRSQQHRRPSFFVASTNYDRSVASGAVPMGIASEDGRGSTAGADAAATTGAASGPGYVPSVWASSTACWNEGSGSLLLELDPGDQAAILREELLRLGAAPGKFLTTIIMEWCDGGTLHDEFTLQTPIPGRLGVRRSGLASGHLLRGLGPIKSGGGGVGSGSFGDPPLQRSCRVSEHIEIMRRGGGGGGGDGGGGCCSVYSGPTSLVSPAYVAESTAAVASGASLRMLCRQTVGGGGGAGAFASACISGPHHTASFTRSSMPLVMPSSGSVHGISSGASATASRSGQQGHFGRQLVQANLIPAASFGSFMMLQPTSGQKQQLVAALSSAVGATASAPDAGADVPAGVSGAGGSASLPPAVWGAATSGRIPVLLRCALEVAQGMSYLHSLNLAHGDLTLKNVLLKSTATSRRGFTCKISDFGLTNPTSTGNCLPADTSRWGTLVYMAPEVLTGRGTLKQADVYSFGAVLWHMCTGRPPHQELRPAQVLVGLATGDLQLVWPDWLDPGVARIGKVCMDPDPSKRPHFDEIVQMLLGEIAARSRSTRRRAADGRSCNTGCSGGPAAAPVPACSSPATAAMTAATALAGNAAAVACNPAMAAIISEGLHQPTSPRHQQMLSPLRSASGLKAAAAAPTATATQHTHFPLAPVSSSPVPQQNPQHQMPNAEQHQQNAAVSSLPQAARCCEWQPVAMPVPFLGSNASSTGGGILGHSNG